MVCANYSINMATPIITGNAALQQYLAEKYRREHEYSLFSWKQRATKAEAHAAAWKAMREEIEKQKRLQQFRRAQAMQRMRR